MSKIDRLLSEFDKYGVTYKVSDQFNGWRVFLYGGDDEIRKKFQANLWNEKGAELQALLVLERAKENPDLMYEIEERAAIREFDAGIKCTLLEVILMRYDSLKSNLS